MTKRQMVYNRSINPDTFVFLYWINDRSWSVRDYSCQGWVDTHYAKDYLGQSPQRILREAQYHFDAPVHDTKDTEFWYEQTRHLNERYLQEAKDGNGVDVKVDDQNYIASSPVQPLSSPPQRRSLPAVLPSFFVPTSGPENWRRLLADPEKHWRDGFSAKALAERWNAAKGFPSEVAAALTTSTTFRDIEFLCGFPEHKVPLPGGERASQNDIFVLARTHDSLVSIAVEGKVEESFGPLLSEWAANASDGKVKRLQFLLETIGLPGTIPGHIRYQLLHRTASAVIEAHRFHARHAILLVHSFSPRCTGFDDYRCFVGLYGQQDDANSVTTLAHLDTVTLHSCWVGD